MIVNLTLNFWSAKNNMSKTLVVFGRGFGWEKLSSINFSFNLDGIPSIIYTHTIKQSFAKKSKIQLVSCNFSPVTCDMSAVTSHLSPTATATAKDPPFANSPVFVVPVALWKLDWIKLNYRQCKGSIHFKLRKRKHWKLHLTMTRMHLNR